MYIVEKKIKFEAGHRLMDYDGPCMNPHGHNYVVKIGIESNTLDEKGMLIDFSDIKETAKKFIKETIDHVMILSRKDKDLIKYFEKRGHRLYLLDENPTAEILAKHLYGVFSVMFEGLIYVTIEETPDSTATYYE